MKKCNKCNVRVNINSLNCPLCKNILIDNEINDNIFPTIANNYQKHNLLFKILGLISICGILICLFINYLINKEISWSGFVIAGIACFWLTLKLAIFKGNNFMSILFKEFNLIILITFLWDYFTDFHKWSINYVIPFMAIIYIFFIFIMQIFYRKKIKEYIVLVYLNCLVGLLSGFLLLFDIITVKWPSVIAVNISIIILVFLAIFNNKHLRRELARKFHF